MERLGTPIFNTPSCYRQGGIPHNTDMDLSKFEGKTLAECKNVFQSASRGLHPNVNGYLYLTLLDKKTKEKVNVYLTKSCSANFKKGDKPYSLKFVKATLSTTGEEVVKLGMGSLEFDEILADV